MTDIFMHIYKLCAITTKKPQNMNRNDLAKAHIKNRLQLRKALSQQKLLLNSSIKTGNKLQEYLSIRIYILLYVAYLETSLNYLLYHYHKQLHEKDLEKMLSETSQEKRWQKLLEFSFRSNFLNKKETKNLDLIDLGHTNYHRYVYIKQLLDNEITSFIGIRNKLAHGQWAIALNNEGTDKVQETTTKIWTLSKKECLHVKNIIDNFLSLMEAVVASKINFGNTYDTLVHKIEFTKRTHSVSYNWIINDMKRRFEAFDRQVVKK